MITVPLQNLRQRAAVKFNKPENLFLVLAALFGLIFIFVTPPYSGWDEQAHMYRVYQLSDKKLLSDRLPPGFGGFVPESLRDVAELYHISYGYNLGEVSLARFQADLKLPLDPWQNVPVHFENTALYSPANYVPQVITVFLLRHLNASPIILLYMARTSGFILWLVLSYVAIKVVPAKKIFFGVALLLPSSIYLATTVTSDTTVIALSALLVALMLSAYSNQRLPSGRFLIVFFLLLLWLALCKQPYWLISLGILPLLIRHRPKPQLTYLASFIAASSIIIGASVGWTLLAQTTFAPYRHDVVIKPNDQMKYVLAHPTKFAASVADAYATSDGDNIIGELTGRFEKALLPTWISYACVVILTLSLLYQDERRGNWELPVYLQLYFAALATFMILCISLLLYGSWTALGAAKIGGLQGRYFVPLLFVLAGVVSLRAFQGARWRNGTKLYLWSSALLIAALCSHVQFNYHLTR